ncbi:hypothetical protein QFZ81_000131 [Paenibacillus sp. V4I9]|uniref:hypothetical protein n=1 Tax=Paenibacillus sp. V4I9 TaxID=3042308 RepID=UPI002786C20B|nr:hypothetical protein [Paenibacillus sp. V4I9]MDQ0885043.1 hypothetical protein [Paenibacillus sp. V4I9]
MNKRAVIVGSPLLLLVLAGFYFSLAASHESEIKLPAEVVIVKEVEANGEHYINYVQGDTLFLKDMNTRVSTPLRKVTGGVRQLITRKNGTPITSYTYMSGNTMVDPVSLKIGIKQSIPYTYDSALEKSFVYLETLLYDGWEITGFYSDFSYVDYYLKKNNVVSRLIILENSMKTFYEIKGTMPDPWTYVS